MIVKYWVTDTQLQYLADAIRAEGNTSALLTYPDGFISAIKNLSGTKHTSIPAQWPTTFNNIYWTTYQELQNIAECIRGQNDTLDSLTYLEDFVNALTVVDDTMQIITSFGQIQYTDPWYYSVKDISNKNLCEELNDWNTLRIKFNNTSFDYILQLTAKNTDPGIMIFKEIVPEINPGLTLNIEFYPNTNKTRITVQYNITNEMFAKYPELQNWDPQQGISISQNIYD